MFEQITIPGVSLQPSGAPWSAGGVLRVALNRLDTRVVYVGTDSQGIYKSTGCGAPGTWSKVSTGRNSDVVNSGANNSLEVDPVDPDVIYANTMYGASTGLFKSINGGVDWDQIFPTPQTQPVIDWIQGVAIDPTNHLHLLLSMHSDCKGEYAPSCGAESYDGGATWQLFKVPTDGWNHSGGMVPLQGSTFLYAAGAAGLFRTEDGGKNWSQPLAGSAFPSIHQTADGTYYLASLQGVLRSTDTLNWTLVPDSGRPAAISGDGTRLFSVWLNDFHVTQPFSSALESDPLKWSTLPSPSIDFSADGLTYDPIHRVMYTPMGKGGLWRFVTR